MARKTQNPANLPNTAREELVGLQQVSRRSLRHKGEHADYAAIDADILLNTIATVTSKGHAIQFGYTKEGSAFIIRLVGTGVSHNDYVRPSEDLGAYLEALSGDYSELSREELDNLLRD
jgi:hypothetical protein